MKRTIVSEDYNESAMKKRGIQTSESYKIKKRKLVNRLVGTLESPSSMVTKCEPISGSIHWTSPSRDRSGTHNIIGTVSAGKIKFECDCAGGFEDEKTGHCIHITSVVVNMIQNFIDSTISFQDSKTAYFDTVKLLNKTKI